MKYYFKKKPFMVSALLTLVILIGFIANVAMKAVFNELLSEATSILGKDLQLANQRL